ncbi:MAG: nitronate monooxygenase [Solirubrobacterales bacterium]
MILNDLDHPIIQAPLAGGPSTPELTAAVGGAGGLGFLAAGYETAPAMRAQIRQVRQLSDAPFGVNVFVPGTAAVNSGRLSAYLERLQVEADRYGVEVGNADYDDDEWGAKLTVLHRERVPIVSFTFGCPPAEVIASLHDTGAEAWVTVTDLAEAHAAAGAGADALVLQGIEAGGHRATFVDRDGVEGFGILVLLRLVAAEIDLPLIASGGLGNGPAIAAVLAAGARAAQLGTAFMLAPEAGTHPAHREALAEEEPTALTRAFSGRLARGIVNRFLLQHTREAPIAFPQIHNATAPIRAAARERGDADGFNLWAGQAHILAEAKPAAEIVSTLSADARVALESVSGRRTRG